MLTAPMFILLKAVGHLCWYHRIKLACRCVLQCICSSWRCNEAASSAAARDLAATKISISIFALSLAAYASSFEPQKRCYIVLSELEVVATSEG